ncbi:MAG: DNA mismatch repair protein MutS [Terriglobia bacterium]
MSQPTVTPLMQQYQSIKKQYPYALVFFRLGDFYELFYDDAVTAARELQITLTARHRERGTPVPMCGVPYHAAEGYIAKLIRKGYKVAICDQVEDPKLAKKLVKREVVRVITPGTAVDAAVLEAKENNYLVACLAAPRNEAVGLAYADLSTGEFRATEITSPNAIERLAEELQCLGPREVIRPQAADFTGRARHDGWQVSFVETPLDDWVFATDYGARLLREQFGVMTLEGLGLEDKPLATGAAGAIVHYLRETQRSTLAHLDRIAYYQQHDALVLDTVSVHNLELVEPLFGNDRASTLLVTLDDTRTALGARLLKNMMLRPSVDRGEIEARLDAVEELARETLARDEIRQAMEHVYDLERLLSKCTLETAHPRDLLVFRNALLPLPTLRRLLSKVNAVRLRQLHEQLDELADLRDLIERAMSENAPASATEPGIIKAGFDPELDSLRALGSEGRNYIAALESRARARTGIGSLKVRFNNVFGYYIEISKPNLSRVPPDYERKQTLVSAERFTTTELKEYERKILEAEEKISALERGLFAEVRRSVAAEAARIRQTAAAVAQLDVLANFAHLARQRDYVRPTFTDSGEAVIVGGRHPVIERLGAECGERFVPNDLYLNGSSNLILLVTGPNMGGKSTYLRQAALIALMAQVGSCVPAERAVLPIFDRIYTRIGASDTLARGRSTFLVEMTEAATILNTATPQSLVLLDEVGRGTATFDGLAIAWAVVEHLHAHTRAKTLFATHYHELTELADLLLGVHNVHVSVKESGSDIVFLRRVEPGSADKSYGIEVAKLAGLPATVIERAREVLKRHESTERVLSGQLAAQSSRAEQLAIFTPLDQDIVEALRTAELDSLRPLDALNLLAELKKKLE